MSHRKLLSEKLRKQYILQFFEKEYPDPQSELNFRNDYELLIAVVLSAQCTDKKVNQVTKDLFKRYPNFDKLSRARVSTLEKVIREVNYFKTKSRHIKALAKIIMSEYEGKIPFYHKALIELPGVGRKTANVILSEKDIVPAIAVDTHVFRVSRRLGFASAEKREGVEKDLMKNFDIDVWRNLHHWLILHGRNTCKARKPLCHQCGINKLCTLKNSVDVKLKI